MTDPYGHPKRLYRVKRRFSFGFGVCHGIADYYGFPVWAVQAAAVILCLAMHVVPFVIIYFIAAFLMKPKPEHDRPQTPPPVPYQTSPAAASWEDLKAVMARLDRRIQRMENVVTSREYDWERRLNT